MYEDDMRQMNNAELIDCGLNSPLADKDWELAVRSLPTAPERIGFARRVLAWQGQNLTSEDDPVLSHALVGKDSEAVKAAYAMLGADDSPTLAELRAALRWVIETSDPGRIRLRAREANRFVRALDEQAHLVEVEIARAAEPLSKPDPQSAPVSFKGAADVGCRRKQAFHALEASLKLDTTDDAELPNVVPVIIRAAREAAGTLSAEEKWELRTTLAEFRPIIDKIHDDEVVKQLANHLTDGLTESTKRLVTLAVLDCYPYWGWVANFRLDMIGELLE